MKRSCLGSVPLILFVAAQLGLVAPHTARAEPAARTALSPAATGVRVEVNSTGMTAVRYVDLVTAGIEPTTVDVPSLRLTYLGTDVAIEVAGGEDGAFDPGDEIRFFGKNRQSIYGTANSYRLSWSGLAGSRITKQQAAPTGAPAPVAYLDTLHLEQDKQYESELPTNAGADHWFMDWWQLQVGAKIKTLRYTFKALAPAASGAATLQVALQGATDDSTINPDHNLRFTVNGVVIGEGSFDGTSSYLATMSFDSSLLHLGDNQVTVNVVNDAGNQVNTQGYTNWLELTYPRQFAGQDAGTVFAVDQAGTWDVTASGYTAGDLVVYDVTLPGAATRLTDIQAQEGTLNFGVTLAAPARFWAGSLGALPGPSRVVIDSPSDLHTTANAADYLVISHADFLAQAQQLAAHRATQGLRTAVVDVQDIYDEFNGGMMSAEAIRDFLAFAYAHWASPAPAYVLLLGDGTYDFKNNLHDGAMTFVPPYLEMVDNLVGETAADNRYVDFDGDRLPEMAIGRLPAASVTEAQGMVDKIVAYESASAGSPWLDDLTLVSDRQDATVDFPGMAEQVVSLLPANYTAERIYYLTTPGYDSASAVSNGILAAANAGSAFISYVGHGQVTSWGEGLWTTAAAAGLQQGPRLPIVSVFACMVGYFIDPGTRSLAEKWLTTSQGGAVAVIAGSGRGYTGPQQELYLSLYSEIFQRKTQRLGDALVAAKQRVAEAYSPNWHDLLDTFHLFGDPALVIRRAEPDVSVTLAVTPANPAPGHPLTLTISYANQGLEAALDTSVGLVLPRGVTALPSADADLNLATTPDGTHLSRGLGELPPGASGVITVSASVDSRVEIGDILSSEANISTTSRDFDSLNNISSITLTAGSTSADIEGMVFVDNNGDGRQDSGESEGIPNVTLQLTSSTGQRIAEAVSFADGRYHFDEIDPGLYAVKVASSRGMASTSPSERSFALSAGDSAVVDFGLLAYTAVPGIEVVSFAGTVGAAQVRLSWNGLMHGIGAAPAFHVERAEADQLDWIRLTGEPVEPQNSSDGIASYALTDASVQSGRRYAYRIMVDGGAPSDPIVVAVSAVRVFLPVVQQALGPR